MARSPFLVAWAACAFQKALGQTQNIIEPRNVTEEDPCTHTPSAPPPCSNGGTCRIMGDSFECDCPWGFSGARCEEGTFWTLQQWQSNECGGMPWRCFTLQMGKCVDTGFTDGNFPNRKNWFGKLTHVLENGGLYTLDLCWGEGEEGEGEPGWDPEDKCKCNNHWTNIRRLGKNSLGPPTEGRESPDSDRCHKLKQITSSRLVNSTGNITGDRDNTICEDPDSAVHRQLSRVLLAVLVLVFAAVQ